MSLLIVGGSDLGEAALVLEATGWALFSGLPLGSLDPKSNLAVVRFAPVAELLKTADERGLAYQLIHIGTDDGEPGGSFERAHHRVEIEALGPLAAGLMTGEKFRLRVLSFGYKQGLPDGAEWVFDVRFLDNPYWDPVLKPLTGLDQPVRAFVLEQPAAEDFVGSVQSLMESVLPQFEARGRVGSTIAFGCTGGRHRSVAVAAEIGRRLAEGGCFDLTIEHRDLR